MIPVVVLNGAIWGLDRIGSHKRLGPMSVSQLEADSFRRGDGSRPADRREAGDPLKVGEIIGYQRRGKGQSMRGNQ